MNLNTSASQSGRVVVNAILDVNDLVSRKTIDLSSSTNYEKLYPYSSTEDSWLSIIPGEALFMHRNNVQSKRKAVQDTYLEVFSSLNGLIVKKNQTIEEKENEMHFVGFADIRCDFDSKVVRNEDCVVQLGGIRTIRNTGPYNIRVGDIIYWKLPDKQSIQPNRKILAEVRPVKIWSDFSKEKLYKRIVEKDEDVLKDLFDQVDFVSNVSTVDEYKDNAMRYSKHVSNLFSNVFMKEYTRIQSHVIGKALSDAKPNSEFDILCGSYTI
jgi:hypothetical protein